MSGDTRNNRIAGVWYLVAVLYTTAQGGLSLMPLGMPGRGFLDYAQRPAGMEGSVRPEQGGVRYA